MFKEIEHLQKVSAVWYDTTNAFERRIAVRLHNGVLTISQRDNPSDIWSPSVKMPLAGIRFSEE